jgi:hypothetical protein
MLHGRCERERKPGRQQMSDRQCKGLQSGCGGFRHAGLSFAVPRRAEYIGVGTGCR